MNLDTLKAFMMGAAARAKGNTMTYFDGVKIKKLMQEHGVKNAQIYLSEDREWTETTVTLKKNGVLEAKSIGVNGSVWATPMLDINREIFDVGTKDENKMNIVFV